MGAWSRSQLAAQAHGADAHGQQGCASLGYGGGKRGAEKSRTKRFFIFLDFTSKQNGKESPSLFSGRSRNITKCSQGVGMLCFVLNTGDPGNSRAHLFSFPKC